MVLGPSSDQAGEDDATGLRGSAHWRLAARGGLEAVFVRTGCPSPVAWIPPGCFAPDPCPQAPGRWGS